MRDGVYSNQKGRGCRSDVVTERLGKAREEREGCVRECVRESIVAIGTFKTATVTELSYKLSYGGPRLTGHRGCGCGRCLRVRRCVSSDPSEDPSEGRKSE
jgi:hypothetical protein